MSKPGRMEPCGECPGCAGGTCDACVLRPKWTRWRDHDPTDHGFDWKHLWVRERRGWPESIVRVRWNATGGRMEPLPFEPPALRELVERKRGWWAPVDSPAEPRR